MFYKCVNPIAVCRGTRIHLRASWIIGRCDANARCKATMVGCEWNEIVDYHTIHSLCSSALGAWRCDLLQPYRQL